MKSRQLWGRQWWGNLLRIGLSLATLALLWREVGASDVWEVLRAANLALLLAAWGLFLVGIVVRTFRWRALLHGLGLRPPFWQLLRLYLVGGFFNAFLPSGFGGDVVRVLELAQGEPTPAAVGTVLVDRLAGILSLMVLGLAALPFAPPLPAWLVWTFVALSGGGLIAGVLLLQGTWLRRVTA
ncbi:MAG: flippase-like domain-containing protein, partial [Chloroflexi bacterium]|nr:flippase-like domain-containing protein [Chloroflexota bacterium]